jgi:hypothetical protein
MRTIRNILLGLLAFTVGIATIQAENMNAGKRQKNNQSGWISVGPSNVSGRVLAIHVDINNNQKIYAGTAGGGLWITTNGGASWNRCMGYTGPAAVSALAQGNDGRLFIGTGEGLNRNYTGPGVLTNTESYGIKGDGIYISDDGGNTFSHVSSTSSWVAVNNMAYDKNNNKLYVATNGGLNVSSDNGNSFANVIVNKTFDVKVGSDGTVICSVQLSGDTPGDVRVSTDNGNSFHSVCGTSDTKIPNAGRISVAIAPSDPNIMYALLETRSGYTNAFYGVYVSIDKGETWNKIFNEGGYNDPMNGSSGIYASAIAVPPTDPTKVLVGSSRLYEGIRVQQDISSKDIVYGWLPRLISGNSPQTIHTIVYEGSTTYIGTSSGIYYSEGDQGFFSSRSRYLSNLQVYSMSVSNDGRIIAGTRENGSIYMLKPLDSNSTGQRLISGNDGGKSVFSLLKPEALFYLSSYGIGYRQASRESDAQSPKNWYGSIVNEKTNFLAEIYQEDHVPRWYPYLSPSSGININKLVNITPNPLAPPLIMWESISDFNSKDTIMYVAEKDHAPGDEICVKSSKNKYPVWITNTSSDTLHRNDTLLVPDIITSRLFLGGGPYKITTSATQGIGAPVFMCLTMHDYDINPDWTCVFRTKDTTEQVMEMVVSNDGNHLFILTQKILNSEYSLYRVSGFDQYRDIIELDVFKYNYDRGAGPYTINDRRMLVDDTLILNNSSEDILSIALDPQNNNNLIYTTNNTGDANPRIKLITNALTATLSSVNTKNKDERGNGLPLEIPVYTALIEMENSDIAYIGTEKGIYMTKDFTSASPQWVSYNEGINISVPVFQLYQQTKNFPSTYSVTYGKTGSIDTINFSGVSNYGIIYAATHGAGIFRDTTYWKKTDSKTFIPGNKYVNNTLKVYPNPANDQFTIDYTLTSSNDQVLLNVIDITGKILYTKNLGVKEMGNHSERLDCSNLPNGFYFVNMIIGRYNKTAKIIISK